MEKMDQYCVHCKTVVTVEKKFEIQDCPNCGKKILPCEYCDEYIPSYNCNECPFDTDIEV